MITRIIIFSLLFAPAYWLGMIHNMHMLQLNGYKNAEHLLWLKKKLRQQWILIFAALIGVVRLFVWHVALDVVCALTLLLIILVYRALHRLNSKKKLVFTPRVKRMLMADLILCAAIITAAAVFDFRYLPGCFMLLTASRIISVIVVNIINHPMEWAINQYYINDAKKKLRSVPGLRVIGVTGSYGKTSVKFYLKALLEEKYNVLATPESYNTPMGVVKTIRTQLLPSHEIFICEMGARHVGDIKEICDIVHPDCGIITSIGPQHLETFHTIDNIKSTKFELADAISDTGMILINTDSEYVEEKAAEYKASGYNKNFIRYSSTKKDGYFACDIKLSQTGTEFTVVAQDGDTQVFNIRLIGQHNVTNVLGAIAFAHEMGIPLRALKIPVRRLEPVEHRLKMLERGTATVIDDAYNSNPEGSRRAVETLGMFDGVRILITPGMVELGDMEEQFNQRLGTYAADSCDWILLVGREHTAPIKRGVLEAGFSEDRCVVFDDVKDAMTYAYSIKDTRHKYILLENDLPDNY